jgi:type I restriction enzyme R subunit
VPHAYTEDQLVEQPAIGLFAALGWQTLSAVDEIFGAGGTLQRETKGEVVLVSRLRAALERSNVGRMGYPALPPEGISASNSIERQTDGYRKHRIPSSLFLSRKRPA